MGLGPLFCLVRVNVDARQLAERVQTIASPIVRALGLNLVEVECAGHGSRTVVRVFIDRADGVSLDDCEQVHLSLSPALDVENPIPHAYTLEVSSPGLDRPLKNREAFQRALGKLVRIKLRVPQEGHWSVVGYVLEVHQAGVTVQSKPASRDRTVRQPTETPTMTIGWDSIAEGRLEVEF